MRKFIAINQLFEEVLSVFYFRALWARLGMPDQTQQKFYD